MIFGICALGKGASARTLCVSLCLSLSLLYGVDLLYPASNVCLAVSPVYKSQDFINNAVKYNMFDIHALIHLLSYNLTTPLLVSTLAFSRPSTASLVPMHVCVRSGGRGGCTETGDELILKYEHTHF